MMKNKYLGLLCSCLLMVIPVSGSHAQPIAPDTVRITVPRNVIITMIKAALPMNLENGPYLKGSLWIQTIDHIKIGTNTVMFDMNIRGSNIKLETQLGSQTLLMDVGNLNCVFSCDASLRYDASKRLLYITPYILQKPTEKKEDKAGATVLQLLSLANGLEYPIEIQKLQPFITQISSDQFSIDMDITGIFTENDTVVIHAQPKIKKVKVASQPKKKSD